MLTLGLLGTALRTVNVLKSRADVFRRISLLWLANDVPLSVGVTHTSGDVHGSRHLFVAPQIERYDDG